MANSVDPDQTALGAVCSGSTLFVSILNSSVMSGNYLQQTTTFSDAFFGTLKVKTTCTRTWGQFHQSIEDVFLSLKCLRTCLRQKSCFIKLWRFRKFSLFVLYVGQINRCPSRYFCPKSYDGHCFSSDIGG